MRARYDRMRQVPAWLLLSFFCSCVGLRDPQQDLVEVAEAPRSPVAPRGPQMPPLEDDPRPPPEDGPIYVHSTSTLYKFEPRKSVLTRIGDFDCLLQDPSGSADSGMHDIAISSRGRLFGVAKVGGKDGPDPYQNQIIVSIDRQTGTCSREFAIDGKLLDPRGGLELRGLGFLPAGLLPSPSGEESLVALEIYGAYLQIDLVQKIATRIGSLNGTAGVGSWQTKGADIVSISGDGTYSTAQGPAADERLVVLDPSTGQVKEDIGSLGTTIFGGMAYWEGTLYGFTADGRIFALDPKTAALTEVRVAVPAGLRFEGAAVTPSAPIFPPG